MLLSIIILYILLRNNEDSPVSCPGMLIIVRNTFQAAFYAQIPLGIHNL